MPCGGFKQFWLFQQNFPYWAYQMTRFYELYPRCSSYQDGIWFLPCPSLLKRNWPASLRKAKAQKPQHWHESMCTDSCFSPSPHVSAQYPDTRRRSSCCFLTFSQSPALHHRKCVICTHTQTWKHTAQALYVCVLNLQSFEVTKPGGLATNCSRPKGRRGGPSWFQRKTHSSYTHLANDLVFHKHRANQCKRM